MTKQEFDAMVAESNEQAQRNYQHAILTQPKNVYKVIFKGKSDSRKTLEIFTTATDTDKAVKKVLNELYRDKDKYAHIFYHYAVYPYGFINSIEYKQLNESGKRFYHEKHTTALLVTGVDTLFIA